MTGSLWFCFRLKANLAADLLRELRRFGSRHALFANFLVPGQKLAVVCSANTGSVPAFASSSLDLAGDVARLALADLAGQTRVKYVC